MHTDAHIRHAADGARVRAAARAQRAQAKNVLHGHAKPSQSMRTQSKKATLQSAMDAIAKHMTILEATIPAFLGEKELQEFAKALNEFTQLPELDGLNNLVVDTGEKDAVKTLSTLFQELETHQTTLTEAMAATAAICSQLTSKRDHLVKLLDDATQIIENSHSKRLMQLEHDMERFMESYKTSFGARPLRDAKQLEHEIKLVETSMSMMLLPHIEICRTIAMATLKLQFQESLDEELFQAYVDDWKDKKQALKLVLLFQEEGRVMSIDEVSELTWAAADAE
ncbi:hypothetical protein FI667_g4699, partial [Globisporangium splendens]